MFTRAEKAVSSRADGAEKSTRSSAALAGDCHSEDFTLQRPRLPKILMKILTTAYFHASHGCRIT